MFAIAVAICILAGVGRDTLCTLAILLIVWELGFYFANLMLASNR